MLARRGDVVTCGKLLDDLDIRHEPGAGKNAFEQIVTEERCCAPSCERGLKGVDVVDAFSGIGAFAEESWYTSDTAEA